MRAQDPRLLWGELGSLRGAVRLVHLVFLLRYSTGAQSIGSQEQVQHENAKSTQYRDQQPTSAPNASNIVRFLASFAVWGSCCTSGSRM